MNWELRINNAEPNWILAARLAKSILDNSDPGYRYWRPDNTQYSAARHGYANWVALACILSELVTPLASRGNPNAYGWLLAGTQKESWKINGGTGLCPKLLHIISQITYLSVLVKEVSNCVNNRLALPDTLSVDLCLILVLGFLHGAHLCSKSDQQRAENIPPVVRTF